MSNDQLELAAIVQALGDSVFSKTLDGTIHSWNNGAEQLYGYRADEVVGKPVSVLAPPEHAAEIEELLARLRRGEAIKRFETVRRRKDGSDVRVSLSLTPVRSPSGEIVGASVITHDISERKRREEIQVFLVEASRLLGVNLDYRETLSRVAHLTLASLADWCLVEVADAAGSLTQVAVAHRDPDKAEIAREMRRLYPPDADRPDILLRVLTTGRSELIPEVSEALLSNIAQNADHLRMLRELGLRSLIVVPLQARGRALGTILLANAESRRRFSPEDLELAEDLARRAALAIDNATLYKSEQKVRRQAERAAERIGRLQAVTAAMSEAATPTEVIDALLRQGVAAAGADGGFVRLLSSDGRMLELVAAMGYSKQFKDSFENVPLTNSLPDADVFLTEELYFESAAAVRAATPDFAREHAATGHEAIAFIPLRGQHKSVGVMALSFANPRTFDDEDRAFLATLASQGALALERARLYEAERNAHAAAEQAVERTTHLQSLAAELADAVTSAQVADIVVRQGVASVGADAGALQLLTDEGRLLEVVREQGSDSSLVGEAWRRLPTDLKLPSPDALRRLQPVFVESEKDFEHYDPVASGLPVRAGAHIPLIVSGQLLGVLFLGFARQRKFTSSQRSFMLGLGQQCAQALKRTQLYEAELEGRSRLSRLLARLNQGVVSVDRRGRVEFANSTAKHMLSAGPLEEGRQVPDDWLGFPLRSFVASLFEGNAGVSAVEAQVVSEDGERMFDVTGIPTVRSEAALLVVTDSSERERRRRVEREFVANAAHELRTPLAAITSAVERLQAGAGEVPEKRERYLGHIQHESARLNRLTASLLVLARAQTREEEPRCEQLALRGLLEELVGGLEAKRGVELVLDCPPDLYVRSNRDLLEHALLNVASNAVRHTVRGSIRVTARASAGGSVTIEVSDTGTGIPVEELDHVFDRFYRGSSAGGRAGFGLGLPIAKEALQAIGGQIEIDSAPGRGTTVRIVLPSVDVPAAA